MNRDSDSPQVPPYVVSRFRLCLLLMGYLCMAAISFVVVRYSWWLVVALLAVGGVFHFLAHGKFQNLMPTRRQQAVVIGGMGVLLLITVFTEYESYARASTWLPIHPVFLWVAIFYGTLDRLRLRARQHDASN